MSQIATCTSCQQRVTIPEGVDPGESVRCPHCEAEYALIAVLFETVEGDDASEPPPELVPVRKTWGTLTFESLPPEERTFGSPRWNERYNGAWYWADGKRTVAQIAELVQLEVGGKPQTKLLALFELAAKAGLCRLAKAKA